MPLSKFALGLLALCPGALAQGQSDQSTLSDLIMDQNPQRSTTHDVTLRFDDIATMRGTGSISSYSYLNFRGFSVVHALTAANLGLIEQNATDCAFSSPNALFGPQTKQPWIRPQFESNATRLRTAGLLPFFNLKGISYKPLGDVPPNLLMNINAWEIVDSEARNVYTYWSPYKHGGHQKMERIEFDIFGDNGWGENVNMVEIFATAPDADEYWDFCVDDLWIELLEDKGEREEI
ncbi:hypothetical protein BJX68DRAFT_269288 [Aspergillus pseudodeflectus]|uniref:Uncharacterized protein n=1 Tax=Aspergillus pseudodeflectus TaxID=176178 RepID=A0ABR4JZ95_9EURO